MISKFKIIGHLVTNDNARLINGNKRAIQLLKFLQIQRLSVFSSIDIEPSFFRHSPIKKTHLKNNPLVAQLQEDLSSLNRGSHHYQKDQLWCYSLIQAVIQDRRFLFIHDDSPLIKSSFQPLVRKILLDLVKNKDVAIFFTQAKSLCLQSMIEYQILLEPFGIKFKKVNNSPPFSNKLAA